MDIEPSLKIMRTCRGNAYIGASRIENKFCAVLFSIASPPKSVSPIVYSSQAMSESSVRAVGTAVVELGSGIFNTTKAVKIKILVEFELGTSELTTHSTSRDINRPVFCFVLLVLELTIIPSHLCTCDCSSRRTRSWTRFHSLLLPRVRYFTMDNLFSNSLSPLPPLCALLFTSAHSFSNLRFHSFLPSCMQLFIPAHSFLNLLLLTPTSARTSYIV